MLRRIANFILILTVTIAVLGLLSFVVTWVALPSTDAIQRVVQEQPYRPRLYDRHGQPLGPHPQGGYSLEMRYNGTYTRIEELPECAIAFAKELEGYNIFGPKLQSLPKCLMEGRGCSSIDMQNARNLFFATAREDSLFEAEAYREGKALRFYRKWTETVMAMKLAWTLSPSHRLELFFNLSTFVPQRRGIGYAVARLFGEEPSEATCAQHLQAISLLPRPIRYRDRDAFLKYYHRKLDHLHNVGQIDSEQHEAWRNPPPFQWHRWNETPHAAAMDRAIREARQILSGSPYRISEGLTVVTAVDAGLQVRADSVLDAQTQRWHGARGSFVLTEPSGFFRIYVVSNAERRGLDFITATEQPGSRVKVPLYFLAVAYLHEQGYTVEEILSYELPTKYQRESDQEVVENCTEYGDSVQLRRAFTASCNGSAYFLANRMLTPEIVSRFLAYFGIRARPYESIAMGSFSTSEEQLVTLYNALLNAYQYVPARIVKRIKTRDGTVIYEAPREGQLVAHRAIAPEVAWIVRQLMRETVATGTAKRLCRGLPDCEMLGVGAKTGSSGGRTRKWRGVTGRIGGQGGMIMSLSLRADGPLPLSSQSAVPMAGDVLRALDPLMNR